MIDPIAKMRACLIADTTISEMVGNRIWGGHTEPPESAKYQPSDGGAIAFTTVGGVGNYGHNFVSPRYQIRCFHTDEVQAMVLYRAVFDRLFINGGGCDCMRSDLESGPISIHMSETDWPHVLAFFRSTFRAVG